MELMLDAERFDRVLFRFDLEQLRSHVAAVPITSPTGQSFTGRS